MAYLPGTEVNHDQEGGSSRVRPGHCTKAWLTSTITPNVGNSSAKFMLYGGLRPRLPPLTVRCRLYFHIRFLIIFSTIAHSNFIFKSLIYNIILQLMVVVSLVQTILVHVMMGILIKIVWNHYLI